MSKENHAPWIKFDWDDFFDEEAVALMNDEAVGLYMRVMRYAWKHDGSIPKGDKNIMALFKLTKHKFNALWPQLAPCFIEDNGRLFQKRLKRELDELKNNFQKNSEQGKINADKGWRKRRDAKVSPIQDLRPENQDHLKPSNLVNSPTAEPGETRLICTISKQDGFKVAQAIEAHEEVLHVDHGNDTDMMKSLIDALEIIPGVKYDRDHILGFVIQSKRSTTPNNVGLCISLIKNAKYAVADSCLADAKPINRKWCDYDMDSRLAEITPDLTVKL